LAGLYTVTFLLGIALPGWRSLAAAAVAGLAIFLFVSVSNDGRVASLFGLAFVLMALFGLGCGIVTRALTLWVAPLGRRPFAFLALAAVGYVVGPMLLAGPAASQRWLTRPSLARCQAAAFPVRIADQILYVPGAPIFSVVAPRGRLRQDIGGFLSFRRERSLLEICGRTLRDREVIGPSILYLAPGELGGSHTDDWKKSTCTVPRGARDALLCRLTDQNQPARRLDRALIYGPELESRALREGAFQIEKDIGAWVLAGRPLEPRPYGQVGSFEVHPNGLRVARGPDWSGRTDEPFGMFCTEGQTIVCAGVGRLAGDLLTRFTLRTAPDRLEADVRAILIYLNEFAQVLSDRIHEP
jgi:hypothetical protein